MLCRMMLSKRFFVWVKYYKNIVELVSPLSFFLPQVGDAKTGDV